MSREVLNLRQAAEHVHIDENELKHFAQRGEVAAQKRGDEWYFEHRALDEWAQRNLLSSGESELKKQHRIMMTEQQRFANKDWGITELFSMEAISLNIQAKAKPGILRDMTELADLSGKVYDKDGLFKELLAREEAASTAIGESVALLHPRFHDPYMFEQSFIAYGRSDRDIFFGAPNGEGTRHFFLICSTDHEIHLHILARLAILAHGSNMIERLDSASGPEEVVAIIGECEAEFRK